MNKRFKIFFFGSLGAMDVIASLLIPLLVAIMWVNTFGNAGFPSYLLFFVFGFASLFRAIKIGWIEK